ncbi:HTH-type transcriptional regulator PuuR [Thalassocella blandensis]|nr:HTH-type transcriptional regulator PuuR [Thalassocella blandensis]
MVKTVVGDDQIAVDKQSTAAKQSPAKNSSSSPHISDGPLKSRAGHTNSPAPRKSQLKESVSDSIGDRLQVLRKCYGLSQRELARRADVTNSTLSMIEQGKVSPSIGSLEKILHAFPVSLQEFFSGNELADDVVVPAEQLIKIAKGKAQLTMFALQPPAESLQMIKQDIPVGAKIPSGWMSQTGFISGLLLQGSLRLTVESVVHELVKGDAFQFSLNRQHEFENSGHEDCMLVSVVY